jgi:hypothetical protein
MSCFRKLPFGLILAFALGSASAQVRAQANEPLLDRNLFSIGVGISDNEISNPDEDDTGFQFFGSYDLTEVNLMEGVDSSVEFGFMDFGFDEDDTGIWGSYVIDGSISGSLGWLAQAGYDIGDDSGLLLGAGLKAMLNDQVDLRFEYVVRDDVDSLQINVLYHL